ncbi:hypothetical protein PR202_ga06258 [Eleusine coracana subsp. coracana]|uniref:peptidylprolyl isomerase n=1 Tax=Eleusine coracana subsp. coracana TaxID=191504 RepID=A0AAV5BUX8_ELECO|nr:hypothetical protein PR202_ga06258 [Eleusine coracana subsp. coracana]
MASSALAPSRIVHRHSQPSSAPPHRSRETCTACCIPGSVFRRRAAAQFLFAGFLTAVSPPPPSLAARRGRKVVPPEDYVSAPDGLKYYDLIEGKGPTAEKGFNCSVSSRESKLLAGNRSIAQRRVIVPPELGYGKRGMGEIPPDSAFEMDIELLQVIPPAES